MNQRGRKKPTHSQDAGGGNALFTLGLVSVIALLIVGWVMQGGIETITGKAKELTNIDIGGEQTAQTPDANQPNTSGQLTAHAVDSTTLQPAGAEQNQAQIQELTDKWQLKLEQERQAYQRQIENLKTNYESQIKDLEMKMKILQLENKTLRSNS